LSGAGRAAAAVAAAAAAAAEEEEEEGQVGSRSRWGHPLCGRRYKSPAARCCALCYARSGRRRHGWGLVRRRCEAQQ
jgi:hypothetical protein